MHSWGRVQCINNVVPKSPDTWVQYQQLSTKQDAKFLHVVKVYHYGNSNCSPTHLSFWLSTEVVGASTSLHHSEWVWPFNIMAGLGDSIVVKHNSSQWIGILGRFKLTMPVVYTVQSYPIISSASKHKLLHTISDTHILKPQVSTRTVGWLST